MLKFDKKRWGRIEGLHYYNSSLAHWRWYTTFLEKATKKKKINQNNYFIIGAGFNILQEKFDEISNAGSLLTQTGKHFDINQFTISLHDFLVEKLQNIPSEQEILNQFNSYLFRKDQISVFELDQKRQNGIIRHADEKGELWIELESGLQSFYHKEIKLLYWLALLRYK